MRGVLLIICFILVHNLNAQKAEFGISMQGGLSTFSSKNSSLQTFNSNQGIPKPPEWIHPSSIWSTKQLDLKVYLSRPKNLSFSIGFRSFRYKWNVDTIGLSVYQGSINPPTGNWVTYYASQENTLEFFLPTIGINYDVNLSGNLWLNNSLSFGVTYFLYFKTRTSNAFDGGQDAFDYQYGVDGFFSWSFDQRTSDIQLQTVLAYNFKYLSVYAGPSLYYYKEYAMRYFGLHINAGVALRFKREDK